MDPYANMGCVLKVNSSCEGCKMKVLEVLSSVCGTYMVTIDAETGLADIQGQVDPNVLLYALAQSGQHAELVKVKLQHPALQMMHPHSYPFNNYAMLSNSCDYGYGHCGHGGTYPIHDPYWYERKLPGLDSSFFRPRSTTTHHHNHVCGPRHAPINPPWISGSCHHHHHRRLY